MVLDDEELVVVVLRVAKLLELLVLMKVTLGVEVVLVVELEKLDVDPPGGRGGYTKTKATITTATTAAVASTAPAFDLNSADI